MMEKNQISATVSNSCLFVLRLSPLKKFLAHHFFCTFGSWQGRNRSIIEWHQLIFGVRPNETCVLKMHCKHIRWSRLLNNIMTDRMADRTIKCNYTNPRGLTSVWQNVIFPLFFQWLRGKALGYSTVTPWEVRNLFYLGYKGPGEPSDSPTFSQ